MNKIEIPRGTTFSIEITTEGKVYMNISSLNTTTEESLTTELKSTLNKNEVECEGDYKGERLGKVKMVKSEIISLESLLGISCLKYWIISLNQFADNEPKKFSKYKSHRACIQNWHKMRLEQGKVFSHIHPSGAGYYFRREIDSLKPEQLKLR